MHDWVVCCNCNNRSQDKCLVTALQFIPFMSTKGKKAKLFHMKYLLKLTILFKILSLACKTILFQTDVYQTDVFFFAFIIKFYFILLDLILLAAIFEGLWHSHWKARWRECIWVYFIVSWIMEKKTFAETMVSKQKLICWYNSQVLYVGKM